MTTCKYLVAAVVVSAACCGCSLLHETTRAPCRNRTSPSCGVFRWAPAPAPNQPVKATLSYSPQQPHQGETVTFTVHAQDPDAKVLCVAIGFADGTSVGERCGIPLIGCLYDPHGSWDTPPAVPSTVDRTFTHSFAEEGVATVTIDVTSEGGPYPKASDQPPQDLCPRVYDHDPYGSSEEFGVTIDVAA